MKDIVQRSIRLRMGLILVVFYGVIIVSCTNNTTGIVLDGEWEYRPGFNHSWLKAHEPRQWQTFRVPKIFLTPDSPYHDSAASIKGFTLRKEIPPEAAAIISKKFNLSLYIPNLTGHVVEIYLNERQLGRIGSVKPYYPAMSRSFLQQLPCDLMIGSGPQAIYVVFHMHKFDRVSHGIYAAPIIDHTARLYSQYHNSQITDFILITVYLVIGMIFIILGLRLRNYLFSLYFGVFALCFAFFEMANLSCREYIFGYDVLLRLKVDQISLKLLIITFTLFITLLFRKKHTRISLGIAVYCGALIVCDLFRGLEQTLDDRYNFWHLAVLIGFPYVLYILVREAFKKNLDALILMIGVLLFAVSSIQNILVDAQIINSQKIPIQYTVLGIFISVVAMLINRFSIIYQELNELNLDLEQKVKQRTNELNVASEKIVLLKRKEKFLQSFDLTNREREILSLIMEGRSANDISENLNVSKRTVNNHIYNLYQKLEVHNRMEILAKFENISL